MQKATAWLEKRFPKLFAKENTNPMKKIFTCLCALLAVQDFEVVDGHIRLTEEQAGKIEDRVAQLEKDLKDAQEALQASQDAGRAAKDAEESLRNQLERAQQDIRQRDEQIANLKQAPGAAASAAAGEHHDEADDISAFDLFKSVKLN